MPHDEPAVFRSSAPKMVGTLLGSLALVAVGLWMSARPGRDWVAIACIAFFGFCALAAAARLFRRPVMLTIHADAVEDHLHRQVPFEDIDHLVLTRISAARFLVIMTREGSPSAHALMETGMTQRLNGAFLPGGSRAMWIASGAIDAPLDHVAERLSAAVPCKIIRLG